jgi:hypothetical protein
MSRFKVKVGEEFEIETVKVEINDDKSTRDPKILEAKHRIVLSFLVLGFAALSIFVASLIGFHEGDYGKVQTVYNVAVIPVTAILSFYFKARPPH